MKKTMFQIMRELRQDHDFTQKEMGSKLGISQQKYQRYENGISPMPVTIAIQLAQMYNVSLDYFSGRINGIEGLDALNKQVIRNYSVSELVSDVLGLSEEDRKDAVKYIRLLKNKK